MKKEEVLDDTDYVEIANRQQYKRLPNIQVPLPQPRMENLEEKVEKKEKSGFWDKMWNKNKLKKGKTIAIIFLRENGIAQPMELEAKKGFFEIAGKSYHEDRDCIWRFNKGGTPLAIIQENSLVPIGTQKWYELRPQENNIDFMKRKMMECQDHILRAIRHAEFVRMGESDKKKMDGKTIIIIIIGLIIGISLFKGKGLF